MLQSLKEVYCGGILVGIPSCNVEGTPGVRWMGGAEVHAALCVLPADIFKNRHTCQALLRHMQWGH